MRIFFPILIIIISSIRVDAQIIDSIQHKNGYLYFHEYGTGDPVILLSGGPGITYHYMEDMAVEIGKSHRAVLVEQRGTGRSIPKPHDSTTISMDIAANDLKMIIEKRELDKVTILGHSFGGRLAIHFTSMFPELVDHVILVNSADYRSEWEIDDANAFYALTNDDYNRLLQMQDSVIAKTMSIGKLQEFYTRKVYERSYWFTKPLPDSLDQKVKRPDSGMNHLTSDLLSHRHNKPRYNTFIDDFDGTVDIICGRQDGLLIYVSYELKIAKPKANLHLINRCGHFPMFEKPNEYYEILNKILKSN